MNDGYDSQVGLVGIGAELAKSRWPLFTLNRGDAMTSALRLCVVVLCLLLASCKVDYSAIRVAPPNEPVAHLVSGLNRASGTPVYILGINGSKSGAVLGREMLIRPGKNTVRLFYTGGMYISDVEFESDFEAGGYYVAEVFPDDSAKMARFRFTRVSADEFQAFMCRAQADLQKRLKNVNPQAAPACDRLRRPRSAAPDVKAL
jgi:hypothetical protein